MRIYDFAHPNKFSSTSSHVIQDICTSVLYAVHEHDRVSMNPYNHDLVVGERFLDPIHIHHHQEHLLRLHRDEVLDMLPLHSRCYSFLRTLYTYHHPRSYITMATSSHLLRKLLCILSMQQKTLPTKDLHMIQESVWVRKLWSRLWST